MISVKEYAESRGKSIQAVHQQRKRQKYRDQLKGHEFEKEGVVYLDDVAIKVLDSAHNSTVAIVDTSTKEKIAKLERKLEASENREKILLNELNQKNNKLLEIQNKLQLQTEQITKLLLDNKEKTILLEQKKEQSEEIERLKIELDREKNKSWLKKVFNL